MWGPLWTALLWARGLWAGPAEGDVVLFPGDIHYTGQSVVALLRREVYRVMTLVQTAPPWTQGGMFQEAEVEFRSVVSSQHLYVERYRVTDLVQAGWTQAGLFQ